jgi:hypothetical protein
MLALDMSASIQRPTTEECGGRVVRTRLDGRLIVEEVHSWSGPLAADDARRLTRDRRNMNRIARRRLARRRKFLLVRRRILAERRAAALLKWDADGDGWLSRVELMKMFHDLLPGSAPGEEDIVMLIAMCAKRDERSADAVGSNGTLGGIGSRRLTPAEALRALARYEVAVSDVASVAGTVVGSIASSLGSLDDLDEFEELLQEERAERVYQQLADASPLSTRTTPQGLPPTRDSRFCAVM